MKTKNIFKALALAMLMPAMVLTTACSNEDDIVNNENTFKKGFELPGTINVTREGDATTRATYNGTTKKLEFSTGDQLFVEGYDATTGLIAGTLEWVSGGTFSGTIITKNEYTGTAQELLAAVHSLSAALLPNGYDKYGYLSIIYGDENKYEYVRHIYWGSNPFAESKAEAVEQFSMEIAKTYSSGFALSPINAILNFTITDLTPSTSVDVTLAEQGCSDITGTVTTDGSGTATFAMAKNSSDLSQCTLTVGGNVIALPTKKPNPATSITSQEVCFPPRPLSRGLQVICLQTFLPTSLAGHTTTPTKASPSLQAAKPKVVGLRIVSVLMGGVARLHSLLR